MPRGTDRPARGTRAGRLLRAVRVVRQVFGAPDYGAYLEHCAGAGGGHAPPLSERQYVKEFFEAKGKVVRCC
jgi:uncharacterized short protein YbdD (DUF466 family)